MMHMDITPYVDSLRRDLVAAAEAGGEDIRLAAERLVLALDPAARLALMEAISQAAAEITAELPTGGVDVRLAGRELDFVVHVATPAPPAAPPPPPVPTEETDEVCSLGHPMVIRLGRNGRFLACSMYPEHKETRPLPGEEPPPQEGTGEVCPKCGEGTLVGRRGKFGPFLGCSRYPDCDYIKREGPPPPEPLPFGRQGRDARQEPQRFA